MFQAKEWKREMRDNTEKEKGMVNGKEGVCDWLQEKWNGEKAIWTTNDEFQMENERDVFEIRNVTMWK